MAVLLAPKRDERAATGLAAGGFWPKSDGDPKALDVEGCCCCCCCPKSPPPVAAEDGLTTPKTVGALAGAFSEEKSGVVAEELDAGAAGPGKPPRLNVNGAVAVDVADGALVWKAPKPLLAAGVVGAALVCCGKAKENAGAAAGEAEVAGAGPVGRAKLKGGFDTATVAAVVVATFDGIAGVEAGVEAGVVSGVLTEGAIGVMARVAAGAETGSGELVTDAVAGEEAAEAKEPKKLPVRGNADPEKKEGAEDDCVNDGVEMTGGKVGGNA